MNLRFLAQSARACLTKFGFGEHRFERRPLSACLLAFSSLLSLLGSSALAAGPIIALRGSNAMVVVTDSGQLQRWDKDHSTPTWSVPLNGNRSGPSSSIALLAQLSDGGVLVVERYGRILRIDPENPGKIVAKTALMEWMRLKVDVGQADPDKLAEQLMAIDWPSAAAIDSAERLFLTSSQEPVVFRVDVLSFFKNPSSIVSIAENRRMFFKDNNIVIATKTAPVPYAKEFVLPGDERGRMNALAACANKIVLGTAASSVFILPADGNWQDGRMRDLADNDKKPSLLDAGCLADGLAFTVVTPETGKQIELWDLTKASEIHSVDTDGGNGPLFTFQAVASSDGKRILAVSDFGLRVWSVQDRRLALLGKQFLNNVDNKFSAGALSDGQFAYWDGATLWILSRDGNSKSRFAGKQ